MLDAYLLCKNNVLSMWTHFRRIDPPLLTENAPSSENFFLRKARRRWAWSSIDWSTTLTFPTALTDFSWSTHLDQIQNRNGAGASQVPRNIPLRLNGMIPEDPSPSRPGFLPHPMNRKPYVGLSPLMCRDSLPVQSTVLFATSVVDARYFMRHLRRQRLR